MFTSREIRRDQDEVVIRRTGILETIEINGTPLTNVLDYSIYKSAGELTEVTITLRAKIKIEDT